MTQVALVNPVYLNPHRRRRRNPDGTFLANPHRRRRHYRRRNPFDGMSLMRRHRRNPGALEDGKDFLQGASLMDVAAGAGGFFVAEQVSTIFNGAFGMAGGNNQPLMDVAVKTASGLVAGMAGSAISKRAGQFAVAGGLISASFSLLAALTGQNLVISTGGSLHLVPRASRAALPAGGLPTLAPSSGPSVSARIGL